MTNANRVVKKNATPHIVIAFDGKKYYVDSISKSMKGSGWVAFVNSHIDQLEDLKVSLYAMHIATFGYTEQSVPQKSYILSEGEEMEETEDEILESLYAKYIQMPLETMARPSIMYDKGWCIIVGMAIVGPSPHKHFDREQFNWYISEVESGNELRKYLENMK